LRKEMRTYVDVSFASGGKDAVVVGRRLRAVEDVSFVAGEHDLMFHWQDVEEFEACILAIHKALAGTGATYRVHTTTNGSPLGEPNSWPPGLGDEPPENPAFPRRKDAKGVTRIR
jgi:hypothetical protein